MLSMMRSRAAVVARRGFAEEVKYSAAKSAAPETPLMHYRATTQATSSMNHRIFFVNATFLVFLYDALNGCVDW